MGVYLGHLGFSYAAAAWMLSPPVRSMHWLREGEAKNFGIRYESLASIASSAPAPTPTPAPTPAAKPKPPPRGDNAPKPDPASVVEPDAASTYRLGQTCQVGWTQKQCTAYRVAAPRTEPDAPKPDPAGLSTGPSALKEADKPYLEPRAVVPQVKIPNE
jgi:hypothetical protein